MDSIILQLTCLYKSMSNIQLHDRNLNWHFDHCSRKQGVTISLQTESFKCGWQKRVLAIKHTKTQFRGKVYYVKANKQIFISFVTKLREFSEMQVN